MKLGLIGRVDNRGIGYQTGSYWQGLGRPRTLIVTFDDNWPCDEGRFGYDDVLFASSNLSARLHDRVLDEAVCREFLTGLDVVLAVETTYDWEFVNWANEMGVTVYVVGNPEMFAHDRPIPMRHGEVHRFPHPKWCWPTTWMLDQLPPGPLLPVPCEDRPDVGADPYDGPLRVLHVAGKHAAGDRNGTFEFIEACSMLSERVHVTVITQERRLGNDIRQRRNVTFDLITGGVRDRWDMYVDQHVLVSPRNYGGLHLPGLEAMASGLALMMSDQPPNETWPGPRARSRQGRNVITPAGKVATRECHPMDLANKIDELARNRELLRDEMTIAREWAEANNWAALEPLYRKTLVK